MQFLIWLNRREAGEQWGEGEDPQQKHTILILEISDI